MSMDIKFSNISASSGGTKILKSSNGAIKKGKITAIIGPNGAGKTTLMSCLVGLRKIDSGHIMLGSNNMHTMNIKDKAKIIGYLPQKPEVNWNISVRHIVALGRTPYAENKDSDTAHVDEAMRLTNIKHLSDRTASELSGGELSRVLFARVLAGDPNWILLDEPMAHLDLAHQLDMAQLLQSIVKRGKTIIIILHDLQHSAQLADDVIIMSKGSIVAHGSITETITEEYLSSIFGVQADIRKDNVGKLQIENITRAEN